MLCINIHLSSEFFKCFVYIFSLFVVKIVYFPCIFGYLDKNMHKNRLAKNLTSLKSYNYSSVNDSVSKDN